MIPECSTNEVFIHLCRKKYIGVIRNYSYFYAGLFETVVKMQQRKVVRSFLHRYSLWLLLHTKFGFSEI
jgi:hypothetical protein